MDTSYQKQKIYHMEGLTFDVLQADTVIIGSGAAGFAAAERLHSLGRNNIALITEAVKSGTSRNTGSDKQTYYKLTLSGSEPDSIGEMAQTLMSGGCVDGDLALCEAALSARCFMHLVELGVPFPCGRFGEYTGYKTDHDPKKRATSAGPYTSRMMTEVLEKEVRYRGIAVYDRLQAVRILTCEGRAAGVLCLNRGSILDKSGAKSLYTVFQCRYIIMATGGPGGMYFDSVYPYGHFGSSGLAFEAGACGKNLTEWQYGLASVKPRWNVSGTYMQSLPRFISTKADGSDEKEFLLDYFSDKNDMLLKIFQKGYQWPFDVRKIEKGSSILDILVFLETQKGRRVFLDFTQNPAGGIDFDVLAEEAKNYLKKAGADFGTPFQRLEYMNEPAVVFYQEHGVSLSQTPLEIALCSQHNNGGIGIDCWWQTNLPGLFCVGEASASHGVYRPGGTALNAGQAGALRAAQYISVQPVEAFAPLEEFMEKARGQILPAVSVSQNMQDKTGFEIRDLIKTAQKRMSCAGAAFRNLAQMQEALGETERDLENISDAARYIGRQQLSLFYRYRDILICQRMYLNAMIHYVQTAGGSRGGALYYDPKGHKPFDFLPEEFRYCLEDSGADRRIQEIVWDGLEISAVWRTVRPIPDEDDVFENVWKQYRHSQNIR